MAKNSRRSLLPPRFMPRYIAFLRAINVGGHVVKMERLRGVFDALGFSRVETLLASGNVIFESRSKSASDLETKIQRGLRKALGYDVATLIRSDAELGAIAKYQAFPPAIRQAPGNVLYIGFLPVRPDNSAASALLARRNDLDDFHFHGRELYWLIRGRSTDSIFFGPLLEKTLGQTVTLRNFNTVAKLVAKYPARATKA